MHQAPAESPCELIVYACPTGPLAAQIATFFTASQERFGPNSAHAYPPHITLTGFFHDDAVAIPCYLAALESAHARAMATRPASPVRIRKMAFRDGFHGLFINAPWLESLTADFIAAAASPSRRDRLRPKDRLHLSLAYGFRPADGSALAAMVTAMVDVAAPVEWELRLYERLPDGGWLCHAGWELR